MVLDNNTRLAHHPSTYKIPCFLLFCKFHWRLAIFTNLGNLAWRLKWMRHKNPCITRCQLCARIKHSNVFVRHHFGDVNTFCRSSFSKNKILFVKIFFQNFESNWFLMVLMLDAFLKKQCIFPIQPQCCLTFWWIELQMLLKCCLIHIDLILPWHFSDLVHMCLCLPQVLFISYPYDLFFIWVLPISAKPKLI